jgi:hypothetical protein
MELGDDWNLFLPGLTRVQAEHIAAIVITWPNVLGVEVVDPKTTYVSWCDYSTAQAILSITHEAIRHGQLTYSEKHGCESLQYELSDWLAKAKSDETTCNVVDYLVDFPLSWDVGLSYLMREQAECIISLVQTWSNVIEPQMIFGRQLMKWYWDYATVRMTLDIINDALASIDLSQKARVIGEKLKDQYQLWLHQAVPVKDEEGYWRHE